MGNYISKCCGQDGRKYKKKKEIIKATQPEQDDPNAKVATNAGATKEIPNSSEPTITPEAKEDEEIPKDKKGEKKDEKKPRSKHKRRKHSETSEDSSDFWTSSSSETSDSSDSDVGHTKSSRKVYKNKGGGTTIVSKKTIIGGNKMTIGKNAKNLTINIGSNTSTPTVNKNTPPPTERPREKPFQSFYSESRAREEESRQFASPWGRNTAPPGGNFIDTRELHLKETVFESSVRVDASNWVCMICFPGGTGTGFRVGTKYIMTANHVVKHILDQGYRAVGHIQGEFANLQAAGVYALFRNITDGPRTDRHKFRFKAIVHFNDAHTDTAVLELEDNVVGTPMPLSFTYFSLPKLNKKFTFIGHSEGKPMEFDHVHRIIDTNSLETQMDIVQVKQMSLQHSGKDYEFVLAHNTLTNPDRFLFRCNITKGASGSPGVVVLEDGRVVVVTMLLCGLPDWYYNTSVSDHIKTSWPKEYCIEQGVNMKSVYEKMLATNPSLCNEIFYSHTDSLPNPTV